MSQSKNKGPHGYSGPKRPRYFHGMLLDEKDFQAEQAYHISRRRLLNRMLHGSGVVCGLDLEKLSSREIQIGPGFALDCRGREIWVEREHRIDLCDLPDLEDPSLVDPCDYPVPPADKDRKTYHVCLEYWECPTDPVSNHVGETDCVGKGCDDSRVREGYSVGLKQCERPESEDGLLQWIRGLTEKQQDASDKDPNEAGAPAAAMVLAPDLDKWLREFCCEPVPCPCAGECGDNCVIIGSITLDGNGCLIEACSNDCRKYVITGHMLGHLVVSLFGEAREAQDKTWTPGAVDFVSNPIEALCRILRQPARTSGSAAGAFGQMRDFFGGATWASGGVGDVGAAKRTAQAAPAEGGVVDANLEYDFAALSLNHLVPLLRERPELVDEVLEAESQREHNQQRLGVFKLCQRVAARQSNEEVAEAAAQARSGWESWKRESR